MIRLIKNPLYDRSILIGRPNLTLKNFKCQNITCNKTDKFKKYKDDNTFICECGYITNGNFEIEQTHKIRFYCKSKSCPINKLKMDKSCLQCEHIGER